MSKKKTASSFQPSINWERVFSHLDNACCSLMALKKELFDYYLIEIAHGQLNKRSRRRIIEGVFDGENLRAGERRFPVSANYASKSKLVTGDKLKLTIEKDGSFIFKVTKAVDRKKMIGKLQEISGRYQVQVKKRLYEVLKASVTYLKAQSGDYVTVVAPKKGESRFVAIENVVK